jgi:hypothetical protein
MAIYNLRINKTDGPDAFVEIGNSCAWGILTTGQLLDGELFDTKLTEMESKMRFYYKEGFIEVSIPDTGHVIGVRIGDIHGLVAAAEKTASSDAKTSKDLERLLWDCRALTMERSW